MPLQFERDGVPAGAFEIYMPYDPIAAAIDRDTKKLYLILFGGLALLYAVLFRIVAAASRRLRRHAAENRHQALHDALTDLPNRTLFHDRIEQALRHGRRDRMLGAVLLIDLDRFKEVNDTLGHQKGDHLLKEIGLRLSGALRESDTIARLGGDEFGVLLPGLGQRRRRDRGRGEDPRRARPRLPRRRAAGPHRRERRHRALPGAR